MTDSLQGLIDDYLPSGWDDGTAQRNQVARVIANVLARTHSSESICERRIDAQNEVASELDIAPQAVISKLGSEMWADQFSGDDYLEDRLDPTLESIETEWRTLTEPAGGDRALFLMPVSDDWISWFRRTVDIPYRFETHERLPNTLAGVDECRIWGTHTGERNERIFNQVRTGDVVAFYHNDMIFAAGIIDETLESRNVGREIWEDATSQFIYTLAAYQRVNLPRAELWDDLGYDPSFTVRGLKRVAGDKTSAIATDAGSLWCYFTEFYAPEPLEELLEQVTTRKLIDSKGEDMGGSQLDDEPVSPTAPYYWVNQSGTSEREEGYLRAPRKAKPYYDLQKLEVGDVVFNYHDGAVVGFSEVTKPAYLVRDDGSEYRRVDVDVTLFDEPIQFVDFYPSLWQEDVRLEKYYPLNQAGINMQYLHNLSEAAGEYLFEAGGTPDSNQARLRTRIEQPTLSVTLPESLHFHEGEAARLRQEINAALNSDRHLIFTGPPGTGKSKLAKHIATQATTADAIDGYTFSTATAEWSTFDTIGGYVPEKAGDGLSFDPRLFLDCFRDEEDKIHNQWLIIDELNRANIDKALGPLFSVLSKDSVTLPYERNEQIRLDWVDESTDSDRLEAIAHSPDRFPVTPAWRLIGTMNTFDKASLYDLSFAFMRRFSFIHVGVPPLRTEEGHTKRSLLDPDARPNYASTWQRSRPMLESTIAEWHPEVSIVWSIVNQYRTIGPAIVLDIFNHIAAHSGGDDSAPLTSAIINLIFPQLEALREAEQQDLLETLHDDHTLTSPEANPEADPQSVSLSLDTPYLERKARDIFGWSPDTGR